MTTTLAPIAALLITTAILLFGQGLQGLLVPVEAARHGFSMLTLGLMGSFYFAGFISGSLFGPLLVRRVGHIRGFGTLATLASIIPLFHVLFPEPLLWILLRGGTGFCFAGLFMIIESWLNERIDNTMRGRVFSAYATINLTAMMGGQLMLFVPDGTSATRFLLASILVSLAVIPVTVTRLTEPKPVEAVRVDLRGLYALSPVAVICAIGIGIASAIFWSLGPIFAAATGHGPGFVAPFMASAVLGAALTQIPLGRWSDRGDRRRVVALGALVAAGAGGLLVLAAIVAAPGFVLLGLSFVFGASSLSIWAIVVAHANDTARMGDFVRVSSGLFLVYGIGAALGPFLAALVNNLTAYPATFAVTALAHALIAIFTIYRMGVRNVLPRAPFVVTPRTATTVYKLDPRAAPDNGRAP